MGELLLQHSPENVSTQPIFEQVGAMMPHAENTLKDNGHVKTVVAFRLVSGAIDILHLPPIEGLRPGERVIRSLRTETEILEIDGEGVLYVFDFRTGQRQKLGDVEGLTIKNNNTPIELGEHCVFTYEALPGRVRPHREGAYGTRSPVTEVLVYTVRTATDSALPLTNIPLIFSSSAPPRLKT